MNNLWTPWRYKYIISEKEKECVFCRAAETENESESGVLYKGKNSIVILNRYPYSNGHLMIAPAKHFSSPEESSNDELLEIFSLMKSTMAILREEYNPDGINVGMNVGTAAGAGIGDHYHLHIVPRWTGDTNFMSVVADTRLIPQSLEEIWNSLKPRFENMNFD